MQACFVQLGPLGRIGRFATPPAMRIQRGINVICRTERGLEVGEVLGPVDGAFVDSSEWLDGTLLRPMSDQDELLWQRIQRHRDRAYRACDALLKEHQAAATLVDVESLFDGSTLYFYFLGEIDDSVESLTAQLAEAYESKVQFRRFAERLAEGCGPGCGTEEKSGCSTGSCAGCGSAGGCATAVLKKRANAD
jgi:cell fate regulator YaaT (PSP1 superfamily)